MIKRLIIIISDLTTLLGLLGFLLLSGEVNIVAGVEKEEEDDADNDSELVPLPHHL